MRGRGRGKKYLPLERYLRAQPGEEVRLTFAEIERIIGAAVPATAWRSSGWWANSWDAGVQARAWLAAGWRVVRVNRPQRQAVFVRREDGP